MPLDAASPRANAERGALLVAAQAWEPPPPVDYTAWAEKHVVFGNESPRPGPYDPDYHPWDRHILALLAPDHPARVVVVKGAAQVIGKTNIANIFIGGSLDMDPGPVLFYQATEQNALRWVKQKWKAFVRGTSTLTKLFPFERSRDHSNSLLYQERADGRGHLQASGANSAPALSQVSAPRQVHDDLAKWEMLPAGDPENQADSRSLSFQWAKILKTGTPLIKPGCRMTANYDRGTQGEFHVPCPHCDHYQPLTWENLKTSIDAIEEYRRAGGAIADEPKPHFTCAGCGCEILEKHRRAAVSRLRLEWRNFDAGARLAVYSIYIWAAYSPSMTLTDLVEGWLAAKGDPLKEQVFYNDVLGLAFEIAGEAPPWEKLKERADALGLEMGRIPRGGLIFTIGVDCQGDRLEWKAKVFGRDRRRWTVEYGVIAGHISDEAAQAELARLLTRTWPDAMGNRRTVDMMAIDAGAWKPDVRDFVKKHPQTRVIMVRGVPGEHAPEVALVKQERDRDGSLIKYQRRYWNVGAAPLKASLYKNLQKTDPASRGFCGFPSGMTEEYFRQLTSERRRAISRHGFLEYRWEKQRDQANEALDTEIYAEAAAIVFGWKRMTESAWDEMEARREAPPANPQFDLETFAAGHAPEAGPDERARHEHHATKANAVRQPRKVGGIGRKVT